MNTNMNADTPTMPDAPASNDAAAGGGVSLNWVDTAGCTWLVELRSKLISVQGDGKTLDFVEESWQRDIYVTPHDGSYIIRFETFDLGVVFSVSAEQAAPLLKHIGNSEEQKEDRAQDRVDNTVEGPLLWPKVSPLAVWALISSAFVFLPVIGIVPGIITVTLLLLHRGKVRRSRAWSHSRGVCVAATCFLVSGLVASALGTYGILTAGERGLSSHTGLGTPDVFPGAAASVDPKAARKHGAEGVPDVSASRGGPSPTRGYAVAGSSFLDRNYNWGLIAGGMVVILLSLTMHEGAHAISAWWLGDDFARRLGRVTINPLAHIDPIGTVVLPLILFIADTGFFFGWARPVPVRTEVLSRPRRDHILISLAGPGANLLLAAASMTLLLIIGCTVALVAPDARVEGFADFDIAAGVSASGFAVAPVFGAVCTVLKLSLFVNVFLAFFNLIPIPPLDGSWVLERMFPYSVGRVYQIIRPYGLLLFLGLMYVGVLRYLLLPALIVLSLGVGILDLCTAF